MICFDVPGTPVTEGSTRSYIRGTTKSGKPKAVTVHDNAAALEAWRDTVAVYCRKAMVRAPGMGFPLSGPVDVDMTFYLARPGGHYGTGRNAGRLKPSAPAFPTGKPDADKLARAVDDALTKAGAVEDDARIVDLICQKRYADGRAPGVIIELSVHEGP